jgi:hypothetical protein
MFYVANIRYCFGSTKLKMFSLPSVIYIFQEQSIAYIFTIKNQEIKKSETKTRKKITKLYPTGVRVDYPINHFVKMSN